MGVLQYGLMTYLPLTYGQVSIAVSFVVLLLWIPLRQWPGLGTVLNAVVIGLAIDATLAVLGPATACWSQIALLWCSTALPARCTSAVNWALVLATD